MNGCINCKHCSKKNMQFQGWCDKHDCVLMMIKTSTCQDWAKIELSKHNKVTVEFELDATGFDEQLAQRTKALEEYKRLKDEIGAASLSCDFGNSEDVSVAVVSCVNRVSMDCANRFVAHVQQAFPNAKVIILDGGATLQLFRKG